MKKTISLILIIALIFSLCGCDIADKVIEYAEMIGEEIETEIEGTEYEELLNNFDFLDPSNDISDSSQAIYGTEHAPLYPSEYLQLSSLSANEKQLYFILVNAVANFKNVVDVPEWLDVYKDDYQYVFDRFYADNPQLFYLSRSSSFTYIKNSGKISQIFLYYTDGNITDQFDTDNPENLINEADRGLIRTKISRFNTAVNTVLSEISADISDLDKEKAIHDYLCKNVYYNSEATVEDYSQTLHIPHYYDAYGALCEQYAVCEGYSKAFQYLCYMVGINASQVSGNGNGGRHMWNIVLIDGVWYHTDVTWDHTYYQAKLCHKYFNLTEEEILLDHEIIIDTLYLPR